MASTDSPPATSKVEPEYERLVKEAANWFDYNDASIVLLVGTERFKVSRNRLTAVCPALKTMFELPQNTTLIPEVRLQNSTEDIKHLLWYIHAEPRLFLQFQEDNNSELKCQRLVSLATVLHMYENFQTARWALDWAFKLLETCDRTYPVSPQMLSALVRVASRFVDTLDIHIRTLASRARDIWCDALADPASDPVSFLSFAKADQDEFLQAHAYFYIMRLEDNVIAQDSRLLGIDRRRLIVGREACIRLGLQVHERPWPVPKNRPAGTEPTQIYIAVLKDNITINTVVPWRPRMDDRILSRRNNLWSLFTVGPWSLED